MKSHSVLAEYPSEIHQLLKRAVQRLEPVARSVILFGSTAKGEFSYLSTPRGFQLYSDFEFLVVVDKKLTPGERARIVKGLDAVTDLARDLGNRTPFFHVDVSFLTLGELERLPPLLRHHELRVSGLTVAGEDVVKHIPEVTLLNLDWNDLNGLLLERLWQVLLYWPVQYSRCEDCHRTAEYLLARNLLELTTILLPYLGVLLPTYRERVPVFVRACTDGELAAWMPGGFDGVIQRALQGKLYLQFDKPLAEYYQDFVQGFMAARRFLNEREKNHSRGDIREWYGAFRYLHKRRRVFGCRPQETVQFLLRNRKRMLEDVLLSFHRGRSLELAGQAEIAADEWREAAKRLEQDLLLPPSGSLPDDLTNFVTEYLYYHRGKRELYERLKSCPGHCHEG